MPQIIEPTQQSFFLIGNEFADDYRTTAYNSTRVRLSHFDTESHDIQIYDKDVNLLSTITLQPLETIIIQKKATDRIVHADTPGEIVSGVPIGYRDEGDGDDEIVILPGENSRTLGNWNTSWPGTANDEFNGKTLIRCFNPNATAYLRVVIANRDKITGEFDADHLGDNNVSCHIAPNTHTVILKPRAARILGQGGISGQAIGY